MVSGSTESLNYVVNDGTCDHSWLANDAFGKCTPGQEQVLQPGGFFQYPPLFKVVAEFKYLIHSFDAFIHCTYFHHSETI